MLTKNGICYDLQRSPYKHRINNIVYVFSSQLHLDKFKDKLQENRDVINYSLSRRFNLNINLSNMADILLYRKIENRGFLVYVDGIEYEEKENVQFSGGSIRSYKRN